MQSGDVETELEAWREVEKPKVALYQVTTNHRLMVWLITQTSTNPILIKKWLLACDNTKFKTKLKVRLN
jgi:hypothetical protein